MIFMRSTNYCISAAMVLPLLCSRTSVAFRPGTLYSLKTRALVPIGYRQFSSSQTSSDVSENLTANEEGLKQNYPDVAPWSNSHHYGEIPEKIKRKNNKSRFRQHVNPLARKFQHPTVLSTNWPEDVYDDISLPLHMDIGCGKGGFLRDLAGNSTESKNYLGLEIRPSVVEYAQERIAKRGLTGKLDYVGCNANVDLERLLTHYVEAGGGPVDIVSIQYPDPHFKASHAKRRVVTAELVETLAKFTPESSRIFLQSDIQSVLDDMRSRFREYNKYFQDEIKDVNEYMDINPLGVPTEREVSVITKDLPVFRTVLRRTADAFEE
uniref:tRNA (guanine(46)-N(7))-methyltransferase n=1 Tax=Asterionellopsis glacialis TaxID=33640 RepID=A0A7S0PU57_9STRA|mmetsp:Transcript_637/g.951  ORF Transcript_637/g.951 Transcript_637/m.951 type:complete len:323 (+) Transcript_637:128-1096(+)